MFGGTETMAQGAARLFTTSRPLRVAIIQHALTTGRGQSLAGLNRVSESAGT